MSNKFNKYFYNKKIIYQILNKEVIDLWLMKILQKETNPIYHSFYDFKSNTNWWFSYKEYEPLEENLQDTQKLSMYHRYVDTKLDLERETFKDAIKIVNYVENECCINTLYEYYSDSLLNLNKKHKAYLITREIKLDTLGKTEDNVKEGIRQYQLNKFFDKYKIQLRVINEFGKVIYKYDPEKRNHHHKPMYCMVKGNHVYALNCDIKALEQNQDKELNVIVKESSECTTYEDAEPNQCKMISSVDDIFKVC